MPTKLLERLMFAQGGLCFFCKQPLSKDDASVEHLVACANGGCNRDDNCVACCRSLNALLGSKPLKEKIRIMLNQKGAFQCPRGAPQPASVSVSAKSPPAGAVAKPPVKKPKADKHSQVVSNLRRLGDAKPRTVLALTNTINLWTQNKLPKHELILLLKRLEEAGTITISGTQVAYK
ncbi:MAG: HNH endonuclease signature motif containing protein [Pirellulaceae bacterium]